MKYEFLLTILTLSIQEIRFLYLMLLIPFNPLKMTKKCIQVVSILAHQKILFPQKKQACGARSLSNLQRERTFQSSEKTFTHYSFYLPYCRKIDLNVILLNPISRLRKVILLNPISRLSRICACFTSPFNLV